MGQYLYFGGGPPSTSVLLPWLVRSHCCTVLRVEDRHGGCPAARRSTCRCSPRPTPPIRH